MTELEILDGPTRSSAEINQTGLMVAVPSPLDSVRPSSTLVKLLRALQMFSTPIQAVLALPIEAVQDQPTDQPMVHLFTDKPEVLCKENPDAPLLRYVNYPVTPNDSGMFPWSMNAIKYENLFKLASKLNVHACTVLGTDPSFDRESLTAEKLTLLLGPGVIGNFDLVMPLYDMQPFDDLMNKSILYPLTRALYGHQVRYPLANEFQISSNFLQEIPVIYDKDTARQQARLIWLVSIAARHNMKICQVRLGMRRSQSHDHIDLSDALEQLTGPLFIDMEENAAYWQRVRGSHEVPTFGDHEAPMGPIDTVDVGHMVDAFRLGVRDLQEVWSLILPPYALLELKKLSRLTPDEFHMPAALWSRIVYDFALAHRLRSVYYTHLFGALTPLYLGWIASYAVALNRNGSTTAEEQVEQLALAYEAEKPYLLSQWRWPERPRP